VNMSDGWCSYQIATGAGDDTIRIWDMRSLRALYTIPAHTSNVADLRFFRRDERREPAPKSEQLDSVMDDESKADAKPDSDIHPVGSEKEVEEWNYRSGLYLASGGYDGVVKIWSADDWQLLRTLTTDSSKVMSVDFSPDAQLLASGTYNRNFQLFATDESVL
jgi:U4/U6 small nuclear ribonucleoprotein PRP4